MPKSASPIAPRTHWRHTEILSTINASNLAPSTRSSTNQTRNACLYAQLATLPTSSTASTHAPMVHSSITKHALPAMLSAFSASGPWRHNVQNARLGSSSTAAPATKHARPRRNTGISQPNYVSVPALLAHSPLRTKLNATRLVMLPTISTNQEPNA